jgi:hypothetical protein
MEKLAAAASTATAAAVEEDEGGVAISASGAERSPEMTFMIAERFAGDLVDLGLKDGSMIFEWME